MEAQIIRDGDQEKYILGEIRSGGNIDSKEEELIKGFFFHLKKQPPRLVSFNGRSFDLPVLKYRAIKYGVTAYSGCFPTTTDSGTSMPRESPEESIPSLGSENRARFAYPSRTTMTFFS